VKANQKQVLGIGGRGVYFNSFLKVFAEEGGGLTKGGGDALREGRKKREGWGKRSIPWL